MVLDTGEKVTAALVREVAQEELAAADDGSATWRQAHDLLLKVALDEEYADFLTLLSLRAAGLNRPGGGYDDMTAPIATKAQISTASTANRGQTNRRYRS
ncbi:hypothetical protein GCM10020000_16690 [Streptomyces olivoverticillatus]